MTMELSFGIIAFRRHDLQPQVLLIQHRHGHWSFPKGRVEAGEEPKECAAREFEEETGLKVQRFLSDHPLIEHYQLFRKGVFTRKTVTYFVAEADGDPTPQLEELTACRWVDVQQADAMITYQQARQLLHQALQLLTK